MYSNVLPLNSTINVKALIGKMLPISDAIKKRFNKLAKLSKYKSNFDLSVYSQLENKFHNDMPKHGIIYSETLHYDLNDNVMLDSYGYGCTNEVVYDELANLLKMQGNYNRPFPMPLDITKLWYVLYKIFETRKNSKYRQMLTQNTIYLGHFSDAFMHMDRKYKITQEIIKMLNFYKVKYVIHTRSDLVASDDYMNLFDKDLCTIKMQISSIKDQYNRLLECGTPSSLRRLKACNKLASQGYSIEVDIDILPIHCDGYFSGKSYGYGRHFDFTSFDMIDNIASNGVGKVNVRFLALSPFSMNQIEKSVDINLRSFYSDEVKRSKRMYKYSHDEIRCYYDRFEAKCKQNGIEFEINTNKIVEM